jgi:hypothetical protein
VIRGVPWLLFYNAAGAVGVATAVDGHVWQKIPGTTLTPDATEGGPLGPPAAVQVGDRVRVYYPAAGQIWAAETDLAGIVAHRPPVWMRLDGDPTTPVRDPMIARSDLPFGVALERVSARAAPTPAGRLRYDLYLTARLASADGGPSSTAVGFASSYTGDRFLAAAGPILPLSPAARAATETPYRDGALLLYVGRAGVRDAILAARSP